MGKNGILVCAALALGLGSGAWWVLTRGAEARTPSATPAPDRAAEARPRAELLAPGEAAGLAAGESPRSGSIAPPARYDAVRKGAWIDGRVIGAFPEHRSEVRIAVRHLPARMALSDDLVAEQAAIFILHFQRQGMAGLAPPPGLSASVDADGRFEIEVTELLRNPEGPLGSIELTATHPLYFEGSVRILPGPDVAARLEDDREVVLAAELHIEPAAILKGRVKWGEVEPPELNLQLAGTLETSLPRLGGEETAAVIPLLSRSRLIEDELVQVITTIQMGQITLNIAPVHRRRVALFPLVGGAPVLEPIAVADLPHGGEFELKVREAGPCVLAVLHADHRPATVWAELLLGRAVEIEEPIALEGGQGILGSVENFGLLPEGGIRVEARRVPARGDAVVQLEGWSVLWSRGAFELERESGTTDEQGSFAIDRLSHDLYRVEVVGAGDVDAYTPVEAKDRFLEVRAPASGLVLELQASMIEVRVTAEGMPLSDEEIERLHLEVGRPEMSRNLGTAAFEEGGLLRVLVRPGQEYELRVYGEGFHQTVVEVPGPEAGAAQEVAIEVTRAGG